VRAIAGSLLFRSRGCPGRFHLAAGAAALLGLLLGGPRVASAQRGSFPELDASARGTALAGNLTTLASNSDAVSWNPAGLLWLSRREVSFSYSDLFGLGLVRHTVAHFGWPQLEKELRWRRGEVETVQQPPPAVRAVGLAISHLRAEAGENDYRETQLAAAYAWRGPAGVLAGLSFRLLSAQSDLEGIGASGRSLSLGIQRPFGPLRLGFAAHNLASSLNWDSGEDDPLPERWSVGLAWTPRKPPVAATAEAGFFGNAATFEHAGAGIEWRPVGSLALRGGFRHFDDPVGTRLDWAAGAGFRWGDLSVDYGFATHGGDLGTSQRWSASLNL
jgi:hypothetical protein